MFIKVLFVFVLRRVTFVQRYKSNQKIFLKNFSVILSVCWTIPPTLAILRGRATSLVREEFSPDKGSCSAELEGFASMQSDREKFLADAFLFFIKLPVALQSVEQKSFYLVWQFQQAVFCIPYKSIEYEAHSRRLVHLLMNNNFWIDLNSLQVKLHEIKFFIMKIFLVLLIWYFCIDFYCIFCIMWLSE